jgi:hypothetical protein
MTTELAPLNITEIQRKAREDIVVELSSDIYRRFQYAITRSPANKTAQFTVYAFDYHECDCFYHIQGLLHEELSGLFPETTIRIRYSENNEWWRYVLVCCTTPQLIGERLTIELSW